MWIKVALAYSNLLYAHQMFKDAVSDQVLRNCLDPGPYRSIWDVHVYEEGEGPSLGPTYLIPVLVSLGTQRAWRQPGEGRPLHICCCCRVWLSTEWACCISKPICQLPIVYFIVSCTYYSFQENKLQHCFFNCVHWSFFYVFQNGPASRKDTIHLSQWACGPFFESAIAISQFEGSTSSVVIPQLFKEVLLRNCNSAIPRS